MFVFLESLLSSFEYNMFLSCQNYIFSIYFVSLVTNIRAFEALQSSEFIYVFQHGWPEWESNSQPGSVVVMLDHDQHPNFTHRRTFDLLNSLSTTTRDPRFNSEVESCLSFFFCLNVLLHPVWLWAVRLADCYLFCLLMMGACDWWTRSRTSPIDSCW